MATPDSPTPLVDRRIGYPRVMKKDADMDLFLEASAHFGPTNSIRELLKDPYSQRTLMNMIRRQVNLSNDRTESDVIYPDSLLIELYLERYSFDNLKLFSLYIIEYLPGMKNATYVERLKILNATLAAGKAWDDAIETPPKSVSDVMSGSYYWSQSDPASSFSTTTTPETIAPATGNETGCTTRQSNANTIECHSARDPYEQESPLAKLNRVYHQALVDYYIADANKSGISDKSTDKFSNVRFLRDTAENLIRVADENGFPHNERYEEIRKVRDFSKEHAQWLAGGRKRVFDDQNRFRERSHIREENRFRDDHRVRDEKRFQDENPGRSQGENLTRDENMARDETRFRNGARMKYEHHDRHDSRPRCADRTQQPEDTQPEYPYDSRDRNVYYGHHSPKRRMSNHGGRSRRDRSEQYDSYRPS
ncbi:hypothetical protein N7456_003433 [Penicillium angulare]|uniref:Uncharacterized protein n=1 Tax=Penicillium angulare TaxID=116970 RepID=A0A9W9FUR6_9EURO|nr:hypothetical protein N7456_003433 [Penicillium angulare]